MSAESLPFVWGLLYKDVRSIIQVQISRRSPPSWTQVRGERCDGILVFTCEFLLWADMYCEWYQKIKIDFLYVICCSVCEFYDKVYLVLFLFSCTRCWMSAESLTYVLSSLYKDVHNIVLSPDFCLGVLAMFCKCKITCAILWRWMLMACLNRLRSEWNHSMWVAGGLGGATSRVTVCRWRSGFWGGSACPA